MDTKGDAGLSVNEFGAEPSFNVINNFVTHILVLFGEYGSGSVLFHSVFD
jgi:hypothetical protein